MKNNHIIRDKQKQIRQQEQVIAREWREIFKLLGLDYDQEMRDRK